MELPVVYSAGPECPAAHIDPYVRPCVLWAEKLR
jgi:hypothetical protein